MIARHIIFFVALITLPYLWVDYRYLLPRKKLAIWKRLLWWIPCIVMLIATVLYAKSHDFIPSTMFWTELYLALMALFVYPVALFSICSVIGWLCRHCRQQSFFADMIGIILGICSMLIYCYGSTVGFNQVKVKHLELSFADLPESFDGCRIIHLSDLHVGTYAGWRRPVLQAIVDSVCEQQPDYVFFTGDLQNTRPEEVKHVADLLSKLPHVYSVLGNHDHGEYMRGSAREKRSLEEEMIRIQETLGWTLLVNETCSLPPRPSTTNPHPPIPNSRPATLYVTGTDNDGEPPFPSLARYDTQQNKGDSIFTIMLQHDPSAWHRHILPKTTAQLTLSGHTHGGQMKIGTLRPTRLRYAEDVGLYRDGERYLHVSSGAGALVPFRLGIPNEIIVITLRRKGIKE